MADKEDERDEDEREDEDEAEADESTDEGAEGDTSDEADEPASAAEGDEEEEEEDEEAQEAPAAAASAEPPPPAAPKPVGKVSAGARLAAVKAAKAAKKAAKKATLAEERAAANATSAPAPTEEEEETPDEQVDRQLHESPVGRAALKAQDWANENRSVVLTILGAAAIGVVGWFGWNAYQTSSAQAAGTALAEAVEISEATIVAEGDDPVEEGELSYESVAARDEAALDAYREVISEHGGSEAAAWAQLGVARILLQQDEAEDARAAYQAALASHGADPVIAMRAAEGIGFTYESEENWDEAREAFERIRDIEDGRYGPVADYHLARLTLIGGDEVAAQEALEALVDTIRSDSEASEPEFPYVLAQAQELLHQLDPSSAEGGGAPDIEEMIRRMMAERAAGGGGGGE